MDADQLTFVLRSTVQAVTLNAISNTIAQLLSCYSQGRSYSIDSTELFRFMTFALLACPPNVLWQSWLERTFPGYTVGTVPGTIDEQTSKQIEEASKQISEKTAAATQTLEDEAVAASKQISDKAAPVARALEEKAAPVTRVLEEKAAAASSAINDNQTVQEFKRRASDGLDKVRSTVKEIDGLARRATANASAKAGFSPAQNTQIGVAASAKAGEGNATADKRLNVRNTAIKFALDQTLGAVVNTVLFIAGMGMLRGAPTEQITTSVKRDTLPLIFAGQKLWPLVSIISFTLVPLEYRPVFGGIVGLFWGIYLSLFAGKNK